MHLHSWSFYGTTRAVLSVFLYDGEYTDGCDYLEFRAVDFRGRLMGRYRYVHVRDVNANGAGLDIWAAPEPYGYQQDMEIYASTVEDTNCSVGWTGHHVHQDCRDCWALTASNTDPQNNPTGKSGLDVWLWTHWLHKWEWYP